VRAFCLCVYQAEPVSVNGKDLVSRRVVYRFPTSKRVESMTCGISDYSCGKIG